MSNELLFAERMGGVPQGLETVVPLSADQLALDDRQMLGLAGPRHRGERLLEPLRRGDQTDRGLGTSIANGRSAFFDVIPPPASRVVGSWGLAMEVSVIEGPNLLPAP